MIKLGYKKGLLSLLLIIAMLSALFVACDAPDATQNNTTDSKASTGTTVESNTDTDNATKSEDFTTTAATENNTDLDSTTESEENSTDTAGSVIADDKTTESESSPASAPTPDVNEETTEKIKLDEPMVLTYDNLHSLSSGKNIVIFLVDRFDAKYYRKMENKSPDFFGGLDGFTYFNDYTSLHCRTYPGVASILTNLEHNYSSSKANAFNYFYSNGGTLRELYESGYTVNVYTETNYVYTDATLMSEYVSNTGYVSLSEEFMVGAEATVDLKERIKSRDFYTEDTPGQFTFIHLFGCHDTSKSSNQNIEDTFEIIYYYIDQMKALGVYEDATIAIMGDHAAALSDSKYIGKANSSDNGTRVTAMLFKRSGDCGTALKRSEAQVSQDELWATIFESVGMLESKEGKSFFDIPEGVDRERRYLFYMYKSAKNNNLAYSQVIEYKITGSANNPENWEMITVPVTTE